MEKVISQMHGLWSWLPTTSTNNSFVHAIHPLLDTPMTQSFDVDAGPWLPAMDLTEAQATSDEDTDTVSISMAVEGMVRGIIFTITESAVLSRRAYVPSKRTQPTFVTRRDKLTIGNKY